MEMLHGLYLRFLFSVVYLSDFVIVNVIDGSSALNILFIIPAVVDAREAQGDKLL